MFSGTVISQAVYLLFYPILTRIYQPSDFGQYAIFIAFLSIGSLVVTGQYESSILLPKKEKNVKYLVWGAIALALFFLLLLH
jgi:O-antigen/teichoic acid export membrane protein